MEITDLDKVQNIRRRMHHAVSIFGRVGKYACNRNMAFCKFQPISVCNCN